MCKLPIMLKKTSTERVPCGRCTECRARRISAWSFRLMQESKNHISSTFTTLTYAPEHINRKHGNFTKNGYMSLYKRDLQDFLRSVRRKLKKSSRNIRYYAVGEYGGETNRPHYHIILFGPLSSEITQHWRFGTVFIGNVTGASIGYCLKYISKPSQIPKHKNDDRLKEFAIMSKGIGRNYVQSKAMVQWHKSDVANRCYVNIDGGKKASMPRYYKDKIYNEEERKKIQSQTIINIADKESIRLESSGCAHKDPLWDQRLEQEKRQIQTPYKDKM